MKDSLKTVLKGCAIVWLLLLYLWFYIIVLPVALTSGTVTSFLGITLAALGVIIPGVIQHKMRGRVVNQEGVPTEEVSK